MYQPRPSRRDRLLTIAGIVGIHAALLFALINMPGPVREMLPQDVVETIDVTEPPPPPPVVKQVSEADRAKFREHEGAASDKNVRSEASPVVVPTPARAPPNAVASPTPSQGSEPTQGSSNVVGQGSGAGGQGSGTGSGVSGSGPGGGGDGGTGVRLVRGITNRDYPTAIQRAWPRGGRIFVRIRVQPDGRVSQCDVMRSFGDRMADQWTCSLILERAVFRAATDASGRPIAAWFGYVQSDTGRFDR